MTLKNQDVSSIHTKEKKHVRGIYWKTCKGNTLVLYKSISFGSRMLFGNGNPLSHRRIN